MKMAMAVEEVAMAVEELATTVQSNFESCRQIAASHLLSPRQRKSHKSSCLHLSSLRTAPLYRMTVPSLSWVRLSSSLSELLSMLLVIVAIQALMALKRRKTQQVRKCHKIQLECPWMAPVMLS